MAAGRKPLPQTIANAESVALLAATTPGSTLGDARRILGLEHYQAIAAVKFAARAGKVTTRRSGNRIIIVGVPGGA